MNSEKSIKANGWALMPAIIFLVLYLGLGILFEYVIKIPMGFYNIPIVVAFLVGCGMHQQPYCTKQFGLLAFQKA